MTPSIIRRHPSVHERQPAQSNVIPAEVGIHFATVNNKWIPAFAGMTIRDMAVTHLARVTPAKAGIHFAPTQKSMDSRSVTKMSGNDDRHCVDERRREPAYGFKSTSVKLNDASGMV